MTDRYSEPARFTSPPDDELPEPDPDWLAETVAELKADGYTEAEIQVELVRLWERVWWKYQPEWED